MSSRSECLDETQKKADSLPTGLQVDTRILHWLRMCAEPMVVSQLWPLCTFATNAGFQPSSAKEYSLTTGIFAIRSTSIGPAPRPAEQLLTHLALNLCHDGIFCRAHGAWAKSAGHNDSLSAVRVEGKFLEGLEQTAHHLWARCQEVRHTTQTSASKD